MNQDSLSTYTYFCLKIAFYMLLLEYGLIILFCTFRHIAVYVLYFAFVSFSNKFSFLIKQSMASNVFINVLSFILFYTRPLINISIYHFSEHFQLSYFSLKTSSSIFFFLFHKKINIIPSVLLILSNNLAQRCKSKFKCSLSMKTLLKQQEPELSIFTQLAVYNNVTLLFHFL